MSGERAVSGCRNKSRIAEGPARKLPAKDLKKVRRFCFVLDIKRSRNPLNLADPVCPVNEKVASIGFSRL
jgi:hypothetical protein